MREDPLQISVVIPTWQRAGALKQTLDSLAKNAAEEAEFEVIVVCDGDDARTLELSRNYASPDGSRTMPVQWVFHPENLGLPTARNTGAARAQGELLLFLDDDTVAAPGLLSFHVQTHLQTNGSGKVAVCGRIVESALAEQSTKTGRWMQKVWMRTLEDFEAALTTEDGARIPAEAMSMSCFGLNCSIRRELFGAVGGFNPLLRHMDEEMELGCRLYMDGVQFRSEPRAVVYHRNDKDLVAYYSRCWWLGGSIDVVRALHLGQRNAQTRHLLALDTGPVLERWANRAFWYGNRPARGLSKILNKVTERTGARGSFRLWAETTRLQQYWAAVRESGTGRKELRELGGPARVLMLHSVAIPESAQETSYYISPGRFRKLLETLKAGGYRSADPMKLQEAGAKWGAREFVLTFDDGYDDFYTEVFPLMEEYGLKPLMFLVAERIGDSNRWDQANGLRSRRLMSAEQIRELRRHGVRFGSHTLTHPSLPQVDDRQLRRELGDSKHQLEDLLGEEISTFAYPFGDANRRVRAAVIEAGYRLAFTTDEGLNVWQDPFAIRRTEFSQSDRPILYRWMLRSGSGPRDAIKYEIAPLVRRIPREIREPLRAAWTAYRRGG
jgi:peptidoglycan/xylan/chitin deacetylase (PgdA/CDA1 family)/GT2 family glycosyltransferase